MANQMDQYLRTLDFVNQSSGDKSVRQDERQLDIRLRVGESMPSGNDNPDYFTVTIQPNPTQADSGRWSVSSLCMETHHQG